MTWGLSGIQKQIPLVGYFEGECKLIGRGTVGEMIESAENIISKHPSYAIHYVYSDLDDISVVKIILYPWRNTPLEVKKRQK